MVAASWTNWLKLKLFGAMYQICAINDCSDSLDDWPYVCGKLKCDHAIKIQLKFALSLTSHLSNECKRLRWIGFAKKANRRSYFS